MKNPGKPKYGADNPSFGKHPSNYRPGGSSRKDGYIRIGIGKKRVLLHRMLMERYLGRALKPSEIVHHVDGNNTNNDISNLTVMTQSEHIAVHRADLLAGKVMAH